MSRPLKAIEVAVYIVSVVLIVTTWGS